MIKRIELKNFKKHQALTVEFTDGLNVIRAPNEGGKSSLLEGIAYALFGSRALQDNLNETVTYGHPVSSLSTCLDIQIEHQTYTFQRGWSGAEVRRDGQVFVTGQTECTRFASELLGMDANLATLLPLATQGNLRGALEQGPKALAELIEDLGGFDLFNQILDAASNKLLIGNPGQAEKSLDRAQEALAALPVPTPVDVDKYQADSQALLAERQQLAESLPGFQTKAAEFQVQLINLQKRTEEINRLLDIKTSRQGDLTRAEYNHQQALNTLNSPVYDFSARLSELEHELQASKDYDQRVAAYQLFKSRKTTDQHWQGTVYELRTAIEDRQALIDLLTSQEQALRHQIALLKSRLTTSSVCGFCNQDVSQFPGVAQKNEALQLEIERCILDLQQIDLAGHTETQKAQKALLRFVEGEENLLRKLEPFTTQAQGVLPVAVSWIGWIPNNPPDIDSIQARIKETKWDIAQRTRAEINVSLLSKEIEVLQGKLDTLNAQIATIPPVAEGELEHLSTSANAAARMFAGVENKLEALKYKQTVLDIRHEQAQRDYQAAQQAYDSASARVKQEQETLAAVLFNNTLLKKVRAARPIIADKLWASVLGAVSVFFSTLRGEVSELSRDKDGFKVNGHSITGLSGSTKDVLGVALRIALIKTFLPSASFMVLDEPAAALDEGRSATLLGFLQGCGFSQILLVTHEEASSAISDNLILIGE
jgi:DNA repair exonuclease SbcCD ATPase subunit